MTRRLTDHHASSRSRSAVPALLAPLGLEGATREEVQARIDTFEAALEDYRERRVFGHVYYARSD